MSRTGSSSGSKEGTGMSRQQAGATSASNMSYAAALGGGASTNSSSASANYSAAAAAEAAAKKGRNTPAASATATAASAAATADAGIADRLTFLEQATVPSSSSSSSASSAASSDGDGSDDNGNSNDRRPMTTEKKKQQKQRNRKQHRDGDGGASAGSNGNRSNNSRPPRRPKQKQKRNIGNNNSNSNSTKNNQRRRRPNNNDSNGNTNGNNGNTTNNNSNRHTSKKCQTYPTNTTAPSTPSLCLATALQSRSVFDTPAGLQQRYSVLRALEGILCRWSDGLAPVHRVADVAVSGRPPGKSGSGKSRSRSVGGSRSTSPMPPPPVLPPPSSSLENVADTGNDADEDDEDGLDVGADGHERQSKTDNTTTSNNTTNNNNNSNSKGRVALISFGSFRLGVHNPSADIDALALAPPHCTRADFFASLVRLLGEDGRVTDLHPVPGAYTPVIKFAFDGIAIDLVFARLADGTKLQQMQQQRRRQQSSKAVLDSRSSTVVDGALRDELQLDDADLIGLDEAGVRSLNGVRVAQYLLQLVPDVDAFRLTLRAVKEWAVVHGLYSNVLGFLGGVNWAILVAWVCVRNEGAPASDLLRLFMQTFARWRWPKPVRLASVSYEPPANVTPLPVWNPKSNPRDRAHIMPIVTPCYPSMNSSYNVGQPQLRRLQHEFSLAERLIADIDKGKRKWDDLFVGKAFFRQHIHFVKIDIVAMDEDGFRAWFGLCESRLRVLIVALESSQLGIQAYPFAKSFRHVEKGNDEEVEGEERHVASFFVALRFAPGVENVDIKPCCAEFLYFINSWDGRQHGMDLTIDCLVQNELPSFVFGDGGHFEDEGYEEADSDVASEASTAADATTSTSRKTKAPRDDNEDMKVLPLHAKDKNQGHDDSVDTSSMGEHDRTDDMSAAGPSPMKRPRRRSDVVA